MPITKSTTLPSLAYLVPGEEPRRTVTINHFDMTAPDTETAMIGVLVTIDGQHYGTSVSRDDLIAAVGTPSGHTTGVEVPA